MFQITGIAASFPAYTHGLPVIVVPAAPDLDAPQFVVHLGKGYGSAFGDAIFGDDRTDPVIPLFRLFQKQGVKVRDNTDFREGSAVNGPQQKIRVVFDKPRRQPRVNDLAVHVRPGTGDNEKIHLRAEREKALKVPLGNIAKTEVPFNRFMEYPGDIGRHAVAAGLLPEFKPFPPVLPGYPEVVELPGGEKNRFPVNVVTVLVPADFPHTDVPCSSVSQQKARNVYSGLTDRGKILSSPCTGYTLPA
jgi:hypothetical protein